MAREIAEKLTKDQQQQLWNEQWEEFHNWSPDTARETHMDENKLEWSEHAFNIAKMANDPKENGKIADNWKPSSMGKSEDPSKSQRDNKGAPVNIIPVPVVMRETHMDNDKLQWAEQAFTVAKMASDPKLNNKIADNWKPNQSVDAQARSGFTQNNIYSSYSEAKSVEPKSLEAFNDLLKGIKSLKTTIVKATPPKKDTPDPTVEAPNTKPQGSPTGTKLPEKNVADKSFGKAVNIELSPADSYSTGLDKMLKGYMDNGFGQKIAPYYSNPSHVPEFSYFSQVFGGSGSGGRWQAWSLARIHLVVFCTSNRIQSILDLVKRH